MREVLLGVDRQLAALPHAPGGRRPLAHAVDGQERSPLEGRREKRAGGVALVVLGEQNRRLEGLIVGAEPQVGDSQLALDVVGGPELALEPLRHGAQKDRPAARRERERGLEDPLEGHERLVVERDRIQIRRRDASSVPGRRRWRALETRGRACAA